MSITFSIPGVPSLILVKADGCDGLYGCVETQWECGCEYIDGPGVNMANGNAWRMMGALGIEQDYCGSIDVEDFRGRILTAMAVGGIERLDVADPASRVTMAHLSEGGATVTDCMLPIADYLELRLPHLLDLCEQARSMGATEIQWA